jgi:hypothetical protein
MKIKNYWGVSGAILVFVVLVLCAFSQTQQSASQTRDEILNLIPEQWKARDLKAMESLADKIIADNKDLAEFFRNENFNSMADRYAQMSGAIKDQDGNVVSSKDRKKFKHFWSDARGKGAKLEFKTISISLTDLGKQSVIVIQGSTSKEEFNYLAYVVHEFSYGPNGAGGSAYDPGEGRDYAHQESCTWSGRE